MHLETGETTMPLYALERGSPFSSGPSLSKKELAYQKFQKNLQKKCCLRADLKSTLLNLFKAVCDIDMLSFHRQISNLHLRPELLKIMTDELNSSINSSTVRFYYSDSKELSKHGLHFGHILLHGKGIDYYLDVPAFPKEQVCVRGPAVLSPDGALSFGTQRASGIAVVESLFSFLVHAIYNSISEV